MFYFFLFLTIITISLCFLLYGGCLFYTLFLFVRGLSLLYIHSLPLLHSLPIRTGAVSLIHTLPPSLTLSSRSYGGCLSYIYTLSLSYTLFLFVRGLPTSLSLSLTLFLFVRGLSLLHSVSICTGAISLLYILSSYSYGGYLTYCSYGLSTLFLLFISSFSLPVYTGF
jgi:hypothetical protein